MIPDSRKIYQYFKNRFGIRKPTPKGWYVFDCPICGGKRKRGVHTVAEYTKCWTCSTRGDIYDFIPLVEDGIKSYQEAVEFISQFEPTSIDLLDLEDVSPGISTNVEVVLPTGYKSLCEGDTAFGVQARKALTKRGLDVEKLDSKGYGYCNKHDDDLNKDFWGYIIIPFMRDGVLRYFIGRDFKGQFLRYKNPPSDSVGVGKADVLYNEKALYLYDEVCITEGALDAETWGDNCTGTLGWSMSEYQTSKYMTSRAKRLVWFPDAGVDGEGRRFYHIAIRQAMKFLDLGKELMVVDLDQVADGKKKDINSIGRDAVARQYDKTRLLTWSSAMKILHGNN